jgi:hypothetical protein
MGCNHKMLVGVIIGISIVIFSQVVRLGLWWFYTPQTSQPQKPETPSGSVSDFVESISTLDGFNHYVSTLESEIKNRIRQHRSTRGYKFTYQTVCDTEIDANCVSTTRLLKNIVVMLLKRTRLTPRDINRIVGCKILEIGDKRRNKKGGFIQSYEYNSTYDITFKTWTGVQMLRYICTLCYRAGMQFRVVVSYPRNKTTVVVENRVATRF